MERRPLSLLSLAAAAVAVAAAIVLLVAGPGHRFGLWHFRTGFTLLRWAAVGGVAAVVLGLVGVAVGGGRSVGAWVGLVVGFVVAWMPLGWYRHARALPPIHDLTTDPSNPPPFIAVLPLRGAAANPAEYGGPEVAAAQGRAYPDLRPLVLPVPKEIAFGKALATARELGWTIVAEDPAEGRIEATDTTFWFGFKDDVVIRVSAVADGRSVVDVRSLSRVGRGDAGTNARRIREYLKKLRGR